MAGAVKHMERSHRNNGSNESVFRGFENRAMIKKTQRETRKKSKGIFSKLKGAVSQVKSKLRKTQSK